MFLKTRTTDVRELSLSDLKENCATGELISTCLFSNPFYSVFLQFDLQSETNRHLLITLRSWMLSMTESTNVCHVGSVTEKQMDSSTSKYRSEIILVDHLQHFSWHITVEVTEELYCPQYLFLYLVQQYKTEYNNKHCYLDIAVSVHNHASKTKEYNSLIKAARYRLARMSNSGTVHRWNYHWKK